MKPQALSRVANQSGGPALYYNLRISLGYGSSISFGEHPCSNCGCHPGGRGLLVCADFFAERAKKAVDRDISNFLNAFIL